ncbi:hypothetical protein SAMN05421505_10222 [Sinosporangium album]|uniref:Uncharacterized protein n=1 Tax=Sinosporangium album TaxID=504805 RepID=A0A1G7RSF9_9ACTN|nr:hypothetical protein SAMN05421505_10222 [Sinosporangium album]
MYVCVMTDMPELGPVLPRLVVSVHHPPLPDTSVRVDV